MTSMIRASGLQHSGTLDSRSRGTGPIRFASLRIGSPGLIVILAGLTLVVLSACNTVEGAGKDVEAAGNAVQDAAD